jgi:hypothetical protein
MKWKGWLSEQRAYKSITLLRLPFAPKLSRCNSG